MNPNDAIWIVGTGGHAVVVSALAHACGWSIAGCVHPEDDSATGFLEQASIRAASGCERVERQDQEDRSLPLAARMDTIPDNSAIAVAIGDNERRQTLFDRIAHTRPGARLPALIHPEAKIESSVVIADGAQVCIGSIVCAGASVGRGVIVNSGAIVEHECEIAPFAHICPGAKLAGRVCVGQRSMVGIGATVIQCVSIGNDAIIGAGSVVLHDVPANTTAIGVPARVLSASG